jgi:hypothetical protein
MEEFIVKRAFLLCCALGLTLSLAACGGGGGSGGGGGGGGSAALSDKGASQAGTAFTHKQLAGDASVRSAPNSLSNANQTASALASGSGGINSLQNGLPVRTTPYTLKVESNGTVALKNGGSSVVTFDANKMNFYTKSGANFSVMSNTKSTSSIASQTDFVWIGSLNYAVFGYWAQVSNTQGQKAHANGGTFYFKNGPGVIDGNYANAHYNGTNLGLFTGIAAGMAKYDDKTAANNDTVIPLMGTASLNIASATSGALVLDFPGFYRLTGNVNTSTSGVVGTAGGFSGSFTGLTKNSSGYAFPVDLPTISGFSGNSIEGQLFGTPGPSGVLITTPGEAAGVWSLRSSTAARDIEITGVFGVKK